MEAPKGGKGTSMKIRPIRDFVAVERDARDPNEKVNGLYIPGNLKDPLTRGTVIAVGGGTVTPKGMRVESELKRGDHILFGKVSGNEVTLDGKKVLLMREEEIYGVLEGEDLEGEDLGGED